MNDWKLGRIGDISKVKSNGTVAEFSYPCSTDYDCSYFYSTLPPGYYKAEVWGAQGGGGSYSTNFRPCAVMGGYSVGVFHLTEPTKVHVFIGGKGEDGKYGMNREIKGGYNGGGSAARDYQSGDSLNDYHIAGGGGGSSDIRLYNTTVEQVIDSRIIVAGGAGGYGYGSASQNYDSHGWGGGEIAGPPTFYNGQTYGISATSKSGFKKLKGENGIYFHTSNNYGAPSAGAGGGYYGGYSPARSASDYSSGGGGSGYIGGVIDFNDIKRKTIAGNEYFYRLDGTYGVGNPGNGAARITLLGYSLTLKSKIEKNYIPGSRISLNLSLTSMGKEEEAKIFRSINKTAEILIKTHPDEGEIYEFTDSFDIPYISGYYSIDYRVQSKSNVNTTLSFDILVTKVPDLQILNRPKPKYVKGEPVNINFELIDDTFSTLMIFNDSPLLQQMTIVCNNILNRSTASFTIPNDLEIDSSHNLTIFAVDEFGLYSSTFSYSYTIVSNRSPDIELTNNISYILDSRKPIKVEGNIRDYEIPSNVCIMTTMDRSDNSKHDCYDIESNEWKSFNFTLSVDRLSSGIHSLSIYCIDDRQGQSNTIDHFFAFSQKFLLVQRASCLCNSPFLRMLSSTLTAVSVYL